MTRIKTRLGSDDLQRPQIDGLPGHYNEVILFVLCQLSWWLLFLCLGQLSNYDQGNLNLSLATVTESSVASEVPRAALSL